MIDITFDFTSDSKGYWDGFLERNILAGMSSVDPDKASATLKEYHRLLWSKELPNGDRMELESRKPPYYLTWKDYYFGSDAIIVSFRYSRYKHIISQLNDMQSDPKQYWEQLIRKAYTIGGAIIFPAHRSSMNQRRGMSKLVSDRWDLTLECIRRYYSGEESPLDSVIRSDKAFYDLFVDFKGYVDFFLLQDAVSDDYSRVEIWEGNGSFEDDGLPKSLNEYLIFIDKEFAFLEKRNKRIKDYAIAHNL